jgi:predicted ATP-binding protein involved in virulence
VDCLDPASNQKQLVQWIAQETYAQLQRRGRGETPQLDAINHALSRVVEGFEWLWFDVTQQALMVSWLEDDYTEDGGSKSVTFEPFDSLSDGQRNVIALIADMAWRASLLNPHLGEQAPSLTPGVVLIDELELHLHPSWQRKIISDLRRAFPKVQLFGTTHSPQIISHLRPENVLALQAQGLRAISQHTQGRDSNALLDEVMGVPARPAEMIQRINNLFAMLDRGDYDNARAEVDTLRGQLGPNDSDLIHAELRLHLEGP